VTLRAAAAAAARISALVGGVDAPAEVGLTKAPLTLRTATSVAPSAATVPRSQRSLRLGGAARIFLAGRGGGPQLGIRDELGGMFDIAMGIGP
jgi:hypothetical protein